MIQKNSDSISSRKSKTIINRANLKPTYVSKCKKIDPEILLKEPTKMKVVLKTATFIALIIFVVAIITAIILYMNPVSYQKGESTDKVEQNFSTILNLQLPITLESDQNLNSVKGRIIENIIDSAYSPAEALLESRSLIVLEITDDEYLWPESLTTLPAVDEFVLPITFKWLAYPKVDVENKLLELTKGSLPADTQFSIQNISYNKLEVTNNPNVYLLSSQLNIHTDKFIDLVEHFKNEFIENEETILEPENVVKYLKIIETDTGWLNIRTGPSTAYNIITKADIGEEFEILDEADGWFQINLLKNLDDNVLEGTGEGSPRVESGWVSSLYTEKINK